MQDRNSVYASRTFKKDKVAWCVLIVFVLASVLGMKGFRENTKVQLRPWNGPLSNRATITVLEFDRVRLDKNENHINPEDLQKLFHILEEDEFEAVSLNDILNFYYGGKYLPEKSVLLMFANGYLETYVAVDPLLKKIKWPAAMTVITENVVNRETFFLYWDRLQEMAGSGVWGLISGGHRRRTGGVKAENQAPESIFREKLRPVSEGEKETHKDVGKEILSDYQMSRSLIEANIPGYQLQAYAPFFNDAQVDAEKFGAVESEGRVLENSFQLRFANSFVGVNDKSSDPLRLRRLRIKPDWNPETVLALMNQGIEAFTASREKTTQAKTSWFLKNGELFGFSSPQKPPFKKKARSAPDLDEKQKTRLRGVPGAGIFFPKEERKSNWVLEADIRLDRGEFWVRQKSSGPGGEWRVGGNSATMNVQADIADGQYENLAVSKAGITVGKWHHLVMTKRGEAIIVDWDGQILWDLPVPVPGNINGDLELWAWSEEGEGSLSLSDVTMSFYPDDIRWLEEYPREEAVQFLIQQAQQVSGLTTITHSVQGNQVEPVPFDNDLFQIISHRYGWDFFPTLKILPQKNSFGNLEYENGKQNRSGEPEIIAISKLKNLVKQNQWTHVHLDLSVLSDAGKHRWVSRIESFKNELGKINCILLITTEGRADVGQSLKLIPPLLNDSESNWFVAERSP